MFVGSLRTVRKEQKIWLPKRRALIRKRKIWYYRSKPYRRAMRYIFLSKFFSYQFLLKRRIKQIRRFRKLRYNLRVCNNNLRKYKTGRRKMLRKIKRLSYFFMQRVLANVSIRLGHYLQKSRVPRSKTIRQAKKIWFNSISAYNNNKVVQSSLFIEPNIKGIENLFIVNRSLVGLRKMKRSVKLVKKNKIKISRGQSFCLTRSQIFQKRLKKKYFIFFNKITNYYKYFLYPKLLNKRRKKFKKVFLRKRYSSLRFNKFFNRFFLRPVINMNLAMKHKLVHSVLKTLTSSEGVFVLRKSFLNFEFRYAKIQHLRSRQKKRKKISKKKVLGLHFCGTKKFFKKKIKRYGRWRFFLLPIMRQNVYYSLLHALKFKKFERKIRRKTKRQQQQQKISQKSFYRKRVFPSQRQFYKSKFKPHINKFGRRISRGYMRSYNRFTRRMFVCRNLLHRLFRKPRRRFKNWKKKNKYYLRSRAFKRKCWKQLQIQIFLKENKFVAQKFNSRKVSCDQFLMNSQLNYFLRKNYIKSLQIFKFVKKRFSKVKHRYKWKDVVRCSFLLYQVFAQTSSKMVLSKKFGWCDTVNINSLLLLKKFINLSQIYLVNHLVRLGLQQYFFYSYKLRFNVKYNSFKKRWYQYLISNLVLSNRISSLLKIPVWVKAINSFHVVTISWKRFYKKVLRWVYYATFLHKSLQKILKRIMVIMLFSFRFRNFYRFMKMLGFLFNRHRRQQRVIRQFFRTVIKKSLFRFKRLLGWQLTLKGKMNRRPRARQLTWWRYRKPAFQNNTMQIIYSARSVVTDFGMYYFRMWVYYWL